MKHPMPEKKKCETQKHTSNEKANIHQRIQENRDRIPLGHTHIDLPPRIINRALSTANYPPR
jgi:hypothetical protein